MIQVWIWLPTATCFWVGNHQAVRRRFQSVSQGHNLHLANADYAAGIMMLERKVSILERQRKVEVLVKFVAVDRDFDSGHLATAPHVIADFQVISKPYDEIVAVEVA